MFIDGAYVSKVYPARIDYLALRTMVERELRDELDEGYYFDADDDPPKATKLHNKLQYHPPDGPGLRVKIYWLHKRLLNWPKAMGGGPVLHPTQNKQFELVTQKAVDVGLIYHMTRSFHLRRWKKLVLAAGDADFHEPVQSLVEAENVELYLVGTSASISQELRPYARRIFEIDKDPVRAELQLRVDTRQTK
jgi:uncharacterized LabA/DUF88 family protein